jgi:hypothetical protein
MSRRYTDCAWRGEVVRVTLGYDRPLDEFFLQVERVSLERTPTGQFIYASGTDVDACCESLVFYAAKLRELGLKIPTSLFLAVAADAIERRGNWIVEHLADETINTILEER